MSNGSSGAARKSYECLAFDISQEYCHGSKEEARKLLNQAGKNFPVTQICEEISEHGWLNKEEVQDLCVAEVNPDRNWMDWSD